MSLAGDRCQRGSDYAAYQEWVSKHGQRHHVPGRWHHTESTACRTTCRLLSSPTRAHPTPSVYGMKKNVHVGQKFTLWLAYGVKYSAIVVVKQRPPNPVQIVAIQPGFMSYQAKNFQSDGPRISSIVCKKQGFQQRWFPEEYPVRCPLSLASCSIFNCIPSCFLTSQTKWFNEKDVFFLTNR